MVLANKNPVHGEKSQEKKTIEIYTGFLLRANTFAWWKLAFKLIFEKVRLVKYSMIGWLRDYGDIETHSNFILFIIILEKINST